MNMCLEKLTCAADSLPLSCSLQQVWEVVSYNPVSILDVTEKVRFDPRKYNRMALHSTDDYQMLILSWGPGQKSEVHNHRGSQCVIRVLSGVAEETVYMPTAGGFFETNTKHYGAGSVFGGEDADIHCVGPPQNGVEPLVTLHVYRPALTDMELFDIVNDRLVRRVDEEGDSFTGLTVAAGESYE